ncbi:hypothetical protein I4F81_009741 [Pyropia yezoensis]|uniref:Uncharacterized protein n=1 Tax=Pyropia yezoensis TaxID=2788 RepID=A0ACC3CBA1_PYRYE|nr:hypothetical protein I4F81_009741 [Neopyropia yezoensis]
MTDQEAEIIIEGPRASDILQWGAPADKPRTRDRYQFFAYGNKEHPSDGLGKVIVEPESDTIARFEELTAEAAAAGKPVPPKPSFFK